MKGRAAERSMYATLQNSVASRLGAPVLLSVVVACSSVDDGSGENTSGAGGAPGSGSGTGGLDGASGTRGALGGSSGTEGAAGLAGASGGGSGGIGGQLGGRIDRRGGRPRRRIRGRDGRILRRGDAGAATGGAGGSGGASAREERRGRHLPFRAARMHDRESGGPDVRYPFRGDVERVLVRLVAHEQHQQRPGIGPAHRVRDPRAHRREPRRRAGGGGAGIRDRVAVLAAALGADTAGEGATPGTSARHRTAASGSTRRSARDPARRWRAWPLMSGRRPASLTSVTLLRRALRPSLTGVIPEVGPLRTLRTARTSPLDQPRRLV